MTKSTITIAAIHTTFPMTRLTQSSRPLYRLLRQKTRLKGPAFARIGHMVAWEFPDRLSAEIFCLRASDLPGFVTSRVYDTREEFWSFADSLFSR